LNYKTGVLKQFRKGDKRMALENINLWFAKDKNNKTVLAKDVSAEIKHNDYMCPICNSCVIPKTGEIMSWHFAHKDASKCNSETMIHWWVKNELIKVGDEFSVDIEGNITKYKCK
jgi:competence CoiA-like predicted nuclease